MVRAVQMVGCKSYGGEVGRRRRGGEEVEMWGGGGEVGRRRRGGEEEERWGGGGEVGRRKGHFISSQPTYAPHVPNFVQSFHIYWSSYEFTFPNFVCS